MMPRKLRVVWMIGIDVLLSLVGVSGVHAQSEFALQPTTSTPVSLGVPNTVAILYRPTTDVLGNADIGIFVMHPYASYTTFAGCTQLAQRGFTVLCANGPFNGNQYGYYGYEQHAPTIAAGLNYLRNTVTSPTIKKALVFGHSAGGPMMSFYDNVAENGAGACTGPEKLIPCVTSNLQNLPKPDGVMLFDSHLGDSLATFTYVDPSILTNANPPGNVPANRDPSLDLFSAANGYNAATTGGTYTSAFVKRYTAAQAERNAELVSQALNLLRAEQQFNPTALGDDIPFLCIGCTAARLWQPASGGANQSATGLLNCTQQPHTLLAHDGTRPVQVVCSVRPPSGQGADGITNNSNINTNVHIYLGAHAMRTNGRYTQTLNDITGLDYSSSAATSAGNAPGITVPIIIIANTGHYFIRPDEILFNNLTSTNDKTLAYEEGAVHGGTECTACETLLGLPAGYYGDTFGRSMDFYAEWLMGNGPNGKPRFPH
jgi:hypothetical protein